ncbi:MAG: peptidoglycan DD-metalloendopeptidase family protein [Gemmatimonadota bacterium]|nr:peptidoglycan DD-metalloendopeptidase family protein [Gemmatimonadota bacterium]
MLLLAPAATIRGQTNAKEQRDQLEQLRREREALTRKQQELKSTVHDLSEEVTLLDRQADMTQRLVASLDAQMLSITKELDATSSDLVRAGDELAVKRASLQRRLVDIYKRGPLYTVEAYLSANTFGELIARYKYLHIVAQRDRDLVGRVELLRNKITTQRASLERFQTNIEAARTEKAAEELHLRDVERERTQSLTQAKHTVKETDERLRAIENTERRLTDRLSSLESERLRDIRGRPATAAASSTIKTSDFGHLDWPTEGTILYNFGRVINPNNTTIRWNGIGIGAAEGSPVKAVAQGRVVVADQFGTYGLTVIVQHGGGDYSVYGSLGRLAVQKGASITKGQIVGYVGTSDPNFPAHLHFEIRPQGRAVDPLEWLRGTR